MDHPSLGSESAIPTCEGSGLGSGPLAPGFILPLPALCSLGLHLPFLRATPWVQTPTGHEIKLTMSNVILTMSPSVISGNWPTLSPLINGTVPPTSQRCH